jgi:hypothetical protein
LGGEIFAAAVVQCRNRYAAFARQGLGALELHLAEFDQGLGRVDLRLRLVQRRLERPLVDGKQEVALLDQCTVLEMDLVEIAADAGAQRNLVDGFETADELIVLDDIAHHRLGYRDNGRGRRFLGLCDRGRDQADRREGRGGKPFCSDVSA